MDHNTQACLHPELIWESMCKPECSANAADSVHVIGVWD